MNEGSTKWRADVETKPSACPKSGTSQKNRRWNNWTWGQLQQRRITQIFNQFFSTILWSVLYQNKHVITARRRC